MRGRLSCCGIGMAVALGAFSSVASANQFHPTSFSCRASAVRVSAPLLFAEPEVANPADSPCASDFRQAASLTIGSVFSSGLLTAQTVSNPGGSPGGQAQGSVANANLSVAGVTVAASLLSAQASSSCPGGLHPSPSLTSSSTVATLSINGGPPFSASSPVTIPITPLVTIYLNRTVVGPGKVTQRALEISSPLLLTDVVAGEATANVENCS